MPCNTPPPPHLSSGDEMDSGDAVLMDDVEIIDLDEMEGETNDDSILTNSSHFDTVFCCNLNNTGLLAVSGGQDEKAFVWDTTTGQTKFEITGHSDSVIAVGFNHDSSLVSSADMNGLVQAWSVESSAKVWSFDAPEISWMDWHPTSNILFVGANDGSCWAWSVPDNNICNMCPGNGSASSCGVLFANGTKLANGFADGSIKIHNTDDLAVIASITGKSAHSSNVISIAASSDDNLIVTGSEDGMAKLFKSANLKLLQTWMCSDTSDDDRESVESVGFFKSHPFVATCTNGGNLRIFDVSTNVPRASINVNAPIVKLICDDVSPSVYIATKGGVELYDGRSVELIRNWQGHSHPVLDMVISPTRDKLLTASDDTTCKVFVI